MLAVGRPVPDSGEPLKHGEGVAMVLTGVAVAAWRAAGEYDATLTQRDVT